MTIINVGPVRSARFAAELIQLGATRILVQLGEHPHFASRPVTKPALREMAASIGRDRLVGIVLRSLDDADLAFAERVGQLEVDVRLTQGESLKPVLRLGLPVRATGLELDHDDDPAWLNAQLDEMEQTGFFCGYSVSIMTSLRSPFSFLRHDAGAHPEDVTVEDIRRIVDRGVGLSVDWAAADSRTWFIEQFPSARWTIYVGERSRARPEKVSIREAREVVQELEASAGTS